MEKTIRIDDKDVKLKATGATPRIYRAKYGRDIFIDVQKITTAMQKGETLSFEMLDNYLDITHTMAKDADPDNVPDDSTEWLEQFGMLSIYKVLPEILNLWGLSQKPTSVAKKK